MRSATELPFSRTKRWWRSERSRNYWLWTILGYKSISMDRGGELRLTATSMRSRLNGNAIQLRDGGCGDRGAARRHIAVHRLARRALEQDDQVLRHLLSGGRRHQQGLQRQLLGRACRSS